MPPSDAETIAAIAAMVTPGANPNAGPNIPQAVAQQHATNIAGSNSAPQAMNVIPHHGASSSGAVASTGSAPQPGGLDDIRQQLGALAGGLQALMAHVQGQQQQPPAQPQLPLVRQPYPASDKGSPAPPSPALDYERELVENPVGMSPAAFAMLKAKVGERKAWEMRQAAANQYEGQAHRIKVDPKR